LLFGHLALPFGVEAVRVTPFIELIQIGTDLVACHHDELDETKLEMI
jgi:hypothetical protein